ncbi:MAG: leucine-rich repeat domain-containing protein [Lachnospiraceae bacterium]|nr:leucine-rich repeat domain-containing protein [Lachnospiraceae bacterium]
MRKKSMRALSVALAAAMVLSSVNSGGGIVFAAEAENQIIVEEQVEQGEEAAESSEETTTEQAESEENKEPVAEMTEEQATQASVTEETTQEAAEETVGEEEETTEEEELEQKLATSLSAFMPDAELQKAVLAAYNQAMGTSVSDLTQAQLQSYSGKLDLTGYSGAGKITDLSGLGKAKKATSIDISTCTKVTSIGSGEFTGCAFSEITLPNSITVINENAFKDCTNLTEITLPDTLTKLGSHAFAACTSLKAVNSTKAVNTLPASLTSVGQQVFVNDAAITEIKLPNFTNGRVLENSASLFSGCKGLKEITIGKSIQAIPAEAFGGAGSAYVDGGLTVTFESGSALEKILSSAFSKAHFANSTIDLSNCTKLNSIADSVFDYATNVDTIILPKTDSLELGAYAFANTTLSTMYESGNVKSGIYLPDSVQSIGKGCFCIYVEQSGNNTQQKEPDVESKIESVSLSPNLKNIPDYAFDGCTALASVTQRSTSPVKVAAIGDCAFRSTAITNTDFLSKMTSLKTIGYQQLTVYGVGNKKADLEKVQSLPQGGRDGSISENAVTHQKTSTKNTSYVYGSEVFTNCRALESVTIPASVTSIGTRAFFFSRVYKEGNITYGGTDVKVEADVKTASKIKKITWNSNGSKAARTIGSEAFHGNVNVTEMVLPENTGDTLAIKPYAFYEMKSLSAIKLHKNGTLQSVTNQLPATVNELGTGAFFWCAALPSVKVSSCPQENAGVSVFEKCIRLEDVTLPNTWTEIPDRLCYDTAVSSLSMSGGESKVTKIGEGAFFGCQIESLDLSGYTSLKEIGTVAFAQVDTVTQKEVTYCYNWQNDETYRPVMKTVIMPNSAADGILFLNAGVFCGQMMMTTFKTKSKGQTGQFYIPSYIPNDTGNASKKACGMGVFAGTGVSKMVYEDPASWTEIPTLTFNACENIVKAEDVLPANKQYLKAIGQAAFLNSSIQSVDLSGFTALTTIGSTGNGSALDNLCPGVFQGCVDLETVKMPKTAYTLGKRTFFMASKGQMNTAPAYTMLTSVDLGGVTKIEEHAFTQAFTDSILCNDKVTVTIPASCTSMGNYAFYKNTRLEKVVLSDSVPTIGTYAFAESTGLTTVGFGKVKEIGNYAFYKCSDLVFKTGYQLPDTLEKIGSSAFSEATSLGSVVFGPALTSIGSNAFNKAGLTSVNFEKAAKLEKIENSAFSNNNSLEVFKLEGTKVSEIGTILQGCLNLTKATFGDEVTYINDNALASCPKLHTLEFASTTTVSTDVFKMATVSNTYTASENNYTITLIVDTPKEPIVIPKGRTVNFPYYVSPQSKSGFNYILIGKDKTDEIDTIDTYLGIKASLSDGCFKVHQSNETQYKVTEPYYTPTAQSSLYTTVNRKKVDTVQVEGLQATKEPVTFSIANSITFNLQNGGTVSATKFVADYKVVVKDVETNGYLYEDKDRKTEISDTASHPFQVAAGGQKYKQCWYSIKDSEATYADIENYDLVVKTDNPDVLIPGKSSGANKTSYDTKNGLEINGTTKNTSTGEVSANVNAQTFYLVAQGVGTAHITVYPKAYPEYERTYTYQVNADVNRIVLSVPNEYNNKALEPGTTFNIFKEYTNTLNQKATAEDMSSFKTYTNNPIVFESDKPDIASIDEEGTVTVNKYVSAYERVTFTATAQQSVAGRVAKTTIILTLYATKTPGGTGTQTPGTTGGTGTQTPGTTQNTVNTTSGEKVTVTKGGSANTPGEVKFVAGSASQGTNVVIPDTVEVDGIQYKVTAIDANAFKGNTKITSVTVGNNIKAIENEAFKGCTSLTTVTISNSVEKIGKNAFNNCKNLKTVTLNAKSSKLTDIGVSAFQNCTALTKITIPNAVKKIQSKAFYNCKKLKTVTIDYKKSALTEIGSSGFQGCLVLSKITLPNKFKKLGKKAFYGCNKLKTITVKSTKVSSVGSNAFKNIHKKAVIKVPKKQYNKYKKLFKGKGQKKTVKIKK